MRYFFNLLGAVDDYDREGYDFGTSGEARLEAVRSAGEYLRDWPELACRDEGFRIEVSDAEGRLVFTFLAKCVDGPWSGDTAASESEAA